MLTIICGEDSVASRDYFINLKKAYSAQGYEVYHLPANELQEINRWLAHSPSLFAQKRVFFTENLNKNRKINQSIYQLTDTKETEIIDWEDGVTLRELKITKGAVTKEFKLPTSIFKLLDTCYPDNLKTFLNILHELPSKMEDGFIFIMLVKHIRNLLLIKSGEPVGALQSWQIAKLKAQARHWRLDQLFTFYDGLYRIEVATKTSTNPFDIRGSLDILACYFL
jgi:hypothetical protein